jgi:DNA-binding MarR family transcriptional regulator
MAGSPETDVIGIEEPVGIDQSRLDRFIGYRLTRAEVRVRKLFVARVESLELKPVEFSILVLVDANHGINLRQVGEALDVSPPNLVMVIERLVKRRLLRRTRGRQDRRVQHLHLTTEGSALVAQAEQEVASFERSVADALTPDEQQVLETVLRKLAAL